MLTYADVSCVRGNAEVARLLLIRTKELTKRTGIFFFLLFGLKKARR
jgi:hypothetical protein